MGFKRFRVVVEVEKCDLVAVVNEGTPKSPNLFGFQLNVDRFLQTLEVVPLPRVVCLPAASTPLP